MSIFSCGTCGHVEFGSAPESCPVCKSPQSAYSQNDNLFTEAAEKSKEAAVKHVPAIKVNKDCGLIPEEPCVDVIVRIGETLHPMEDAHFINWIDCYVDGTYIARALLTPGSYPAVIFHNKKSGSKVRIVEYCNKHGHWQSEADLG